MRASFVRLILTWLVRNMAGKKKSSKRKQVFNQRKEVRAIARERVGTVKAARVIVPKADRKPKHKKPVADSTEE